VPQYTTKHTHPRPVAYTRGLNTALLTFTLKLACTHARGVRYGKHKDLEGISIDDLERAIKKLGSLGRGFEIIEVRCVVCLDVLRFDDQCGRGCVSSSCRFGGEVCDALVRGGDVRKVLS
jgi:hypothetical protein